MDADHSGAISAQELKNFLIERENIHLKLFDEEADRFLSSEINQNSLLAGVPPPKNYMQSLAAAPNLVERLAQLKNTEIYVYQGAWDMNCPVSDTKELMKKTEWRNNFHIYIQPHQSHIPSGDFKAQIGRDIRDWIESKNTH